MPSTISHKFKKYFERVPVPFAEFVLKFLYCTCPQKMRELLWWVVFVPNCFC